MQKDTQKNTQENTQESTQENMEQNSQQDVPNNLLPEAFKREFLKMFMRLERNRSTDPNLSQSLNEMTQLVKRFILQYGYNYVFPVFQTSLSHVSGIHKSTALEFWKPLMFKLNVRRRL